MTFRYRRNVGLCVVDESTGLVFAARRVDDSKGTWQMPQGGIDAGEEPREAALRELEEETGIRPGSVRFVAEMSDWLCYDFPTSVQVSPGSAFSSEKREREKSRETIFVFVLIQGFCISSHG